MAFAKGAVQSEQLSSSSKFNRLQFLSFKDGDEPVIVRFIDSEQEWPVVEVHIAIPTKPQPENRKDRPWPPLMGATCQNDRGFRIEGPDGNPTDEWEEGMGNCYIHSHYADRKNQWNKPLSTPVTTTFARVVLREEVGGVIRDKTEEAEVGGKKIIVPAIRVISQQWKAFFSEIKHGAFDDGYQVCGRDYLIHKVGKKFTISAASKDLDHRPGKPSWKVYEDAVTALDADLEAMIRDQASERWYKLWFIPGPWDTEPIENEAPGAGTAVETEPGAGSISTDERAELEELRKRLKTQAEPAHA